MRMHDGERCIVANGANVAQVIGQPLELRHQRAQITRPRRHIDAERGLDRMRKRDAVATVLSPEVRGASFAARAMVAPFISDSMPLCT